MVAKLFIGTSTDINGSVVPTIVGSVGGAALFIIIFLLCAVILCARQYHNKEELVCDAATDDADKLQINPNPFYDSMSGGVKLEDNPSYNKMI